MSDDLIFFYCELVWNAFKVRFHGWITFKNPLQWEGNGLVVIFIGWILQWHHRKKEPHDNYPGHEYHCKFKFHVPSACNFVPQASYYGHCSMANTCNVAVANNWNKQQTSEWIVHFSVLKQMATTGNWSSVWLSMVALATYSTFYLEKWQLHGLCPLAMN